MKLLGFYLSSIMLQAYYDTTSFSPLFILILLALLGIIFWIRIKNKKANDEDSELAITKVRHEKRILWSALTGWLMFSIPVAVSCGSDMEIFLDPNLWMMSIPGALIGAIAGILMNNKEKKGESATAKNEETLESKIKGLKNLLDEGLLTQEEFDEQKRKILNN